MRNGFDPNKYLQEQSEYILERVRNYDKLYLEFGGKLLFDLHAKRVLPGFDENAKIKLLEQLKDQVEVIICVYSGDIERNKLRGDFGITYDVDVLRLIDDLRMHQLTVNSVVITRYEDKPSTNIFMNKLSRRGIKVYAHKATKGYPTDVDTIVSAEGYGQNPYIETTRPLVVVTAPGPGSGKLATCLSQLYYENKRGMKVGYSKFETFPVWNLPIKHPVNIAYEAATADLHDKNMIDPFHLDAYGTVAVNYNRDVEAFPVLRRIIERITGEDSVYKSPTDMGVNRVGFGIVDDMVVQEAAKQEVIRRYFKTKCEYKKGQTDESTLERVQLLMEELGLRPEDRLVVNPARERAMRLKEEQGNSTKVCSAVALEMSNGTIVTGKSSELMGAAAAALLNAVKYHANIADEIHLLSPVILEPMLSLKKSLQGQGEAYLSSGDILIALSICAATNPMAQVAMDKLPMLRNCQAHATTILPGNDERIFNNLGIDITCDSEYATESLYYNN